MYITLLIPLFINALIALPCQQSRLNIVTVAIKALNDLTTRAAVYIS